MVTKELSSLLFLTSFLSASCRPTRFVPFTVDEDEKVTFPDDRKKSLLTPPEAVDFMEAFGYLDPGPADSAALYTEDAITAALTRVQKFGAIPQTGRLDDETKKLLASPRCGNKDIETPLEKHRRRKRYAIGGKGWNKRKIRYHLANWTPKLGNETFVRKTLKRAFSAWGGFSRLRFLHTDDPMRSDITILFGRYSHGDSHPFDGPGRVLAHAFYPYEFGSFGGDVHFDEDEDWDPEGRMERTDFLTVAVHELGHSLGLAHSPVADSVMFPYYRGAVGKDFQLGYDDILAMYELYIQRPIDDVPDSDDVFEASTSTTSRTTTTATTTPATTTTTSSVTTSTTTTDGGYDYQNDGATDQDDDTIIVDVNADDICSGGFDELVNLRGELFGFKGKNLYRYGRRGLLVPGYPAPFQQMFGTFSGVSHIDAVYERPRDGFIVFFSGNQYWVFDGFSFVEGSPRPLVTLGLPPSVRRVDAAFVWGKNGKSYIFSGELYWRYDEAQATIEKGYPQRITERWRGIPANIDSVFTWTNGQTYFFKADLFWKFDDDNVIADVHHTQPTSAFWLGC